MMTYHETDFNEELWKNIEPIYNSDLEDGVVQIAYSDRFKIVHAYLRALITKEEMSERALHLTLEGVDLNPANYTIWEYRRMLLRSLNVSLRNELAFIGEMIKMNPKNYQVWHHRQMTVDWLGDASSEHEFIASILIDDAKNYHAWQYRYWVNNKFEQWSTGTPAVNEWRECTDEIDFTAMLIDFDCRNNSAWNHRYQASKEHLKNKDYWNGELEFVMRSIDMIPNNESSWNYLKGIVLVRYQSIKDIIDNEPLWSWLEALLDKQPRLSAVVKGNRHRSRFLLEFVLDALTDKFNADRSDKSTFNQCMQLIQELSIKDQVRKNYWKYRENQLSTFADI